MAKGDLCRLLITAFEGEKKKGKKKETRQKNIIYGSSYIKRIGIIAKTLVTITTTSSLAKF